MIKESQFRHKTRATKYIFGLFLAGIFFGFGVSSVDATTTVKILSNSRHAYSSIIATIDQLLGRAHNPVTEFVVHSTDMASGYAGSDASILLSNTARYDESGALVPSQAPYQIYTSSFTGYFGDTINQYDLSATNDIVHNYAFTASTNSPPPAFHVAPGNGGWASASGVEWTINPTLFCVSTLSCLTAANAGIMGVLRFNHPTWNWFDVKAALRQTGTNWATGYNNTTYGFGQVNFATATALTNSQIFLQPPMVQVSTSTGRISFTIYPFRQTRRVKEVLFQFSTPPVFQGSESTLGGIQSLGGTKIMEYNGSTATTSAPFFAPITNAYFIWFTADNATDSIAKFSRIDTYSVLGPASQNEVSFNGTFNTLTPLSNTVSTTQSPTFTWEAAGSYLGIAKYQLFIDNVLDTDNISGTSAIPTTPLSPGTHTWYVKAFNGTGTTKTTVTTPIININAGYTSGYTFYVDNVLGNDSNPGSQASPWATLTKAGNTAVAGDTVIIIKNANQPYRETLAPINSGTATSSITFRGVDVNSKPEIWGSVDVSTGWSVYGGGNPNTYQRTLLPPTSILAVGSSLLTLTKRTGTTSTMLNPGEWYWSGGTLYYRLMSGESIGSLRMEAASLDYGIAPVYWVVNYTSYQNLIIRYANSFAVYIQNKGHTVSGVEAYDSDSGIYLEGRDSLIKYVIAARNNTYGIFVSAPLNNLVYNSLFYGNLRGAIFYAYSGRNVTFKNNTVAGNTISSLSFTFFLWGVPTFNTSNNAWDIAGDSNWNIYKGTNNQELVNPLFVATSSNNFTLQAFSPAIDTGTMVPGLTTDILGNPIYGTPDIGPYEYQPPYLIGTEKFAMTAVARIYADGKYRYTSATSSASVATLTVTPVGGFPLNDFREWMNITVSRWDTSGNFRKTWTESSVIATSTLHSVGNLRPSELYSVTVDGAPAPYVARFADSSGAIQFTYNGGYSTHTFDVIEQPTAGTSYIYGCMDPLAQNYSVSATSDDGRCTYPAGGIVPVIADGASVTTTTPTTASAGTSSGGSVLMNASISSTAVITNSVISTGSTLTASTTQIYSTSSMIQVKATIEEQIIALQEKIILILRQLIALLRVS